MMKLINQCRISLKDTRRNNLESNCKDGFQALNEVKLSIQTVTCLSPPSSAISELSFHILDIFTPPAPLKGILDSAARLCRFLTIGAVCHFKELSSAKRPSPQLNDSDACRDEWMEGPRGEGFGEQLMRWPWCSKLDVSNIKEIGYRRAVLDF